MTLEEFEKVFESEETDWTGDNAFKGLQIIAEYIDINQNDIIGAAEHDIIYSESTEVLVEAGITKEDAIKLRKLNWMISEDCLACFV